MSPATAPDGPARRRYLSAAAAAAFLTGASRVRVGTTVRWAAYVAVPVIPTMVELGGWSTWQKLPLLPTFHIIYWWAVLVCGVILSESISRGRQAVRWQEFWLDRGRNLGGITEDIGELLIHRKQDGRAPSLDAIIADLLRQVVRLTTDVMQPPPQVKLMACLHLPEYEPPMKARRVKNLRAAVYNEAAGRQKTVIPSGARNPAWEAFVSSSTRVVADTSSAQPPDATPGVPEYRSVAAFAVNVGNDRGRGLAVVTIDSSEPNFFTEQGLRDRGVEAAIFPYLKLLGIALLADSKGRLPW